MYILDELDQAKNISVGLPPLFQLDFYCPEQHLRMTKSMIPIFMGTFALTQGKIAIQQAV